jgi:hypothetical protein
VQTQRQMPRQHLTRCEQAGQAEREAVRRRRLRPRSDPSASARSRLGHPGRERWSLARSVARKYRQQRSGQHEASALPAEPNQRRTVQPLLPTHNLPARSLAQFLTFSESRPRCLPFLAPSTRFEDLLSNAQALEHGLRPVHSRLLPTPLGLPRIARRRGPGCGSSPGSELTRHSRVCTR